MSSEERASWGQLRPMLHLTRGCPTLIPHPLSALSFPFFPFSHFSFPGAGSCLRVLLHLPGDAPPCRPPPTHPYSTPSLPLTRSKEVSGVTVSTACRLSAPLPLLTQKSPTRLRRSHLFSPVYLGTGPPPKCMFLPLYLNLFDPSGNCFHNMNHIYELALFIKPFL